LRYLLAGTPVEKLQPGDLLRGDDGQLYPVESVTATDEWIAVYNARIADYHTYYVCAPDGNVWLWAHNTCKGNPGPSGKHSTARYLAKRWDKGTFGNVTKSIEYHLARHGMGMSAVQYTQRAMKAFADPLARIRRVTDKQGRSAIRLISPNFGEGLFTPHGRIIWFHPKMP
jgi:hypothetical protein